MIGGGGDYNVTCEVGCPISVVGNSDADAIAAWNDRPAEAQIADLTRKLEMAEKALEAIRLGDTQVYDDDLECLVTVSADAEEMSAWADEALTAIRGIKS